MNDLIEKISEQTKENFPNVKFRTDSQNEMTILSNDDKGFDIIIQQGDRENTIHFGSWHFHFENDIDGKNELLDYLGFGMSKLGRLKVYLRSGEEFKWIFETLDEENGVWHSAGTLSLMNIKFWKKPEIKYYQNNLININ